MAIPIGNNFKWRWRKKIPTWILFWGKTLHMLIITAQDFLLLWQYSHWRSQMPKPGTARHHWVKRETLLAVNTHLSGRRQDANTDYRENHSEKFNLHSQGQTQACNSVMAGVQALKASFKTTVEIMLSHPSWKWTPLNIEALKRLKKNQHQKTNQLYLTGCSKISSAV